MPADLQKRIAERQGSLWSRIGRSLVQHRSWQSTTDKQLEYSNVSLQPTISRVFSQPRARCVVSSFTLGLHRSFLFIHLFHSFRPISFSCAPQFRMSAGGDSGQKGPAVSAQEAQMQAIMQQARVRVHTHIHTQTNRHTQNKNIHENFSEIPREFLMWNCFITRLFFSNLFWLSFLRRFVFNLLSNFFFSLLLIQLAMRGSTGPMGLTGRPGPLVCISNHTGEKKHNTQHPVVFNTESG